MSDDAKRQPLRLSPAHSLALLAAFGLMGVLVPTPPAKEADDATNGHERPREKTAGP